MFIHSQGGEFVFSSHTT